jgi:hypothetical protein
MLAKIRPLETVIDCELQFDKMEDDNKRFDAPLLMRGILYGFRVHEFCKLVDDWVETNHSKWEEILNTGSTECMWQYLMQGIRPIALDMYSVQATKDENGHLLSKKKLALLCKGRELMYIFVRNGDLNEIKHSIACWKCVPDLKLTDRETAKLVRARAEQSKKDMSDEVWYAWDQRDLGHMWKVGKQCSTKKNSHNSSKLSVGEWEQGLCRPGREGGVVLN